MKYLLLLLLFIHTLQADTISFVFENDLFAGTDQHYTNGLRLEWLTEPLDTNTTNFSNSYTKLLYKGVDALPLLHLDPTKKHNAGMSVYQMMYTPEEINTTEPNYDDIPYAGHLMFSFFLFEYNEDVYDEYKLQLGVIGPASGAETVQKSIHKLTDSTPPLGWYTQLETQLTLGIAYDHGRRLLEKKIFWGLQTDIIGNYGGQLGNFISGLNTKLDLRIGQNYPKNFNTYFPGSISDSALLSLQEYKQGFGWSFTGSMSLDGIAYFYITDSDPQYNLDRALFHGGYIFSASLYYQQFVLSVAKQSRVALSDKPEKSLQYGAVSLIWRY